ncbi:Uncharacterised protein [Citrobacter amalonaticus]|nr:Uncharacterised protein [Citrobacter amalonaticus]
MSKKAKKQAPTGKVATAETNTAPVRLTTRRC